jgi:hypothetical protein
MQRHRGPCSNRSMLNPRGLRRNRSMLNPRGLRRSSTRLLHRSIGRRPRSNIRNRNGAPTRRSHSRAQVSVLSEYEGFFSDEEAFRFSGKR